MSRILIVEDEQRITAFLEKGLNANGFTTSIAPTGEEALGMARIGDYQLIILDLGLPGIDGLEILRHLRAQGARTPILVLTARNDVRDTVTALEAGADDYLTKPFSFDELLARIRVRLRGDHAQEQTVLTIEGAALDLRTRKITVGQRQTDLSAREFALAEMLFRHPGQVLSREQLLSQVWGYDFDPGSNIVDVYIGYLRRKLGKTRITNIRGAGYRLEATTN